MFVYRHLTLHLLLKATVLLKVAVQRSSCRNFDNKQVPKSLALIFPPGHIRFCSGKIAVCICNGLNLKLALILKAINANIYAIN